jgi:hypothetical protein
MPTWNHHFSNITSLQVPRFNNGPVQQQESTSDREIECRRYLFTLCTCLSSVSIQGPWLAA